MIYNFLKNVCQPVLNSFSDFNNCNLSNGKGNIKEICPCSVLDVSHQDTVQGEWEREGVGQVRTWRCKSMEVTWKFEKPTAIIEGSSLSLSLSSTSSSPRSLVRSTLVQEHINYRSWFICVYSLLFCTWNLNMQKFIYSSSWWVIEGGLRIKEAEEWTDDAQNNIRL